MKNFLIKSTCAFFISVLVGMYIRSTDKKMLYYFMSSDKPKREITIEEYVDISKRDKDEYEYTALNLSKEQINQNTKAISYGLTSFAGLMIILSILELRNKNK